MIFWCFDGDGVGGTFAASPSKPFRFMILDFSMDGCHGNARRFDFEEIKFS
jgi:hypothetical protein